MRALLRHPRRCAGGRSAAVTVEMAVLIPVLMTMMLGMFELSRGMMVKQALTGAARKGCRTGIIHQYGNNDITNDVTNVMQDNGFDTSRFNPPTIGSITIIVTDASGNTLSDALDAPPGSTVSVQVSIPVSSIAWVSSMFLTGNMLESDQIVMMKQ
ncbi:MAG TPA: TadE/TadG family type IV pilus assembly protein [Gemmataceae bacterium]